MLSNKFNVSYSVQRMQWLTDVDGNRYSSLVNVTTSKGHLQQASKELVEFFEMNFQKSYSLWVSIDDDIQVGDTLTIDTSVNNVTTGDTFTVRGVQHNNYGMNPHLEVLIEGGK